MVMEDETVARVADVVGVDVVKNQVRTKPS